MNYFALVGAILSGAIALGSLLRIAAVTSGKRTFESAWGLPVNTIMVAGFGTLAVFLFNVAVQA